MSNPTDEAPNSCFCPSHYWGFDQKQQLGAFSLVELTGAFIQPCLPLTRRMAINVVSLACVSWVSIPRGRENQSGVSELCERPPLT